VKLILRKYIWKHIVIVALLITSSKTIYENWSNFIHNLIYSSRDITKRYPRIDTISKTIVVMCCFFANVWCHIDFCERVYLSK